MNATIRNYMKKIGKKGGLAGLGVKHQVDHDKATIQARAAANTRWEKVKTMAGVAVTAVIWVYLGYMAAVVLAN